MVDGITIPTRLLNYQPPGPVAEAFLRATPRALGGGAGCKIIIGPVGSGKTRAAAASGIGLATKQPPSPLDRARRYKICVVRNTYRQLWASTIESWWKQVPKDAPGTIWHGGEGGPASHECRIGPLPDGTFAELVLDFVAFGDKNPREILSGYEPSAFWFEEIDLLPMEALLYALSRVGRYPDRAVHGAPWWAGVMGVCNAFDVYHPLHKVMFNPPDGWKFFRQPSGFSPNAENVANLPQGYYATMAANFKALGRPDLARRLVANEHGVDRADGRPVFDEAFASDRHVSAIPLAHDEGRPIVLGGDAGLHPAVVACQTSDRGQWRVLAELYREGEPAPEFARTLNRFLRNRFGHGAVFTAWGDPASASRTETSSLSWLQIMARETGIAWRPAPGGNSLDLRLGVVRAALARDVGLGAPGMIVDPKCEMVVTGFAGGYRYRDIQGDGARLDDKPLKNAFSHPMDALQNALLGGGEYVDIIGRREARGRSLQPAIAATEFSVYAY